MHFKFRKPTTEEIEFTLRYAYQGEGWATKEAKLDRKTKNTDAAGPQSFIKMASQERMRKSAVLKPTNDDYFDKC